MYVHTQVQYWHFTKVLVVNIHNGQDQITNYFYALLYNFMARKFFFTKTLKSDIVKCLKPDTLCTVGQVEFIDSRCNPEKFRLT